ncbi:unnamed protein product [Absidia cylindrospora]
MLVNNNCVSVKCKSDASCQASHTNYCVKAGFGKPLCNRNKYCECFSPFKPRKPPTRTHGTAIFRCRRDADDNDGCPANKVCHPNGFCVDKTSCQYHGGSCSSTFKCCHDRETKLYCHTRSFSSKPLCLKNAFVRESCASGIPCEYGSVCMPNKICSLRETDACDAPGSVCPPKSKCKHASAAEGVNKHFLH